MKKTKLLFIIISIFSISINSFAQETATTSTQATVPNELGVETNSNSTKNSFGAKLKESNFHIGLELQTKYIWRGIEYATAPVLFPQMSYSNWGLNVYAMGGYAVNGSHAEVDLGISYTFYGITIGLNDYYYPTEVGTADKYFNFKREETGHSLEACIGYYPEKLPFWILASTYVAGSDLLPESGKNAYSC